MIASMIVAMSQNHVIGKDNQLPWHLPVDLKRFRAITSGHPVIMGRKTYESINMLLPKRTNVIITRQADYKVEGAVMARSLEEALAPYKNTDEEVFILGGGEIFKQSMNVADKLYLTLIHKDIEGDVFFPEFDASKYKVLFREDHQDPMPFSFIDYQLKN